MLKHCWSEHRQEITLCWSENTLHKDLTDTVGCLNVCQDCLCEKSRSETGLAQISYWKPNLFFYVLFPPPPPDGGTSSFSSWWSCTLFHSHKCSQKCCEKITIKVRTSNMEFVCRQGILRELGGKTPVIKGCIQWKGCIYVAYKENLSSHFVSL